MAYTEFAGPGQQTPPAPPSWLGVDFVSRSFDLAIVGAGIVGLAHALAAARRGKRVCVIERDTKAVGASVRNFGFVTVTGQQAGEGWRRATRAREIWAEVATAARIPIEHRGLIVVARRPEAMDVLEAFRRSDMGAGCALMVADEARARFPVLDAVALEGAMWSPHELRVESRTAMPRLGDWLRDAFGVTFLWETAVLDVAPPVITTSAGRIAADACIVCPGDDRRTLFADRLAAYSLETCTLQMLRLAPQPELWRLPAAVMSDLSLVRYRGYADLPEAAALRARLMAEQPEALAHGVHLIVVQSADGSLVVGDSHHGGATVEPFAAAGVEAIILDELAASLAPPEGCVVERWIGTYPTAADGRLVLVDRPSDAVRVVVVTSGTGASTAFALAEEVVADLIGGVVVPA